jgi:hypothetical protein
MLRLVQDIMLVIQNHAVDTGKHSWADGLNDR